MPEDEIRRRIFAVDMQGLLRATTPKLEDEQKPFAQERAAVAGWTLAAPGRIDLKDVLRNAKATVLIGFTAKRGMFDAEILRQMAGERPAAGDPGAVRTPRPRASAPRRRRSPPPAGAP